MSFFDKKEEVLELRLTPYGRHLMSRGKLIPVYYSFLDDDIMYDSDSLPGSSGFSEDNSEIKERIINETPSIKPIVTMNSMETTINEKDTSEPETIWTKINDQLTIDQSTNGYLNGYKNLSDLNTKFLQNTIGTSSPLKTNSPRWDFIDLFGNITKAEKSIKSTLDGMQASTYTNDIDTPSINLNIPQIDLEIEYVIKKSSTQDVSEYEQYLEAVPSSNLPEPEIYADNTYLNITEDQTIARIYEKNGFEYNEAFDIQVLKYNTSDAKWKKLYFLNKPKRIIKDILIDDKQNKDFEFNEVTKDTVEYYFDIRADEEIPNADICAALKGLEGYEDIIKEFDINFDIECKDLIITPDTPALPDSCQNVECDDEEEII
jgi:hypothetical protein